MSASACCSGNFSKSINGNICNSVCAGQGHAQWTPKTLIRIVVPFPAGGVADITARHLANKMTKILGQNVMVDNRGGMNGMLGAQIVAKAKPDGYTLLMPTSTLP